MNFFLVHLSFADILTAIFTLIPEIAWTLTLPAFWGGDAVCKIIKFLQVKKCSSYFVLNMFFEDAWSLPQLLPSVCDLHGPVSGHL